MKIIYYADENSLGDTTTAEADYYRSFVRDELRREYPEAKITISEDNSLDIAWTDAEEEREEIIDFCSRLWDRCPWH